jgi:hypothetical protein
MHPHTRRKTKKRLGRQTPHGKAPMAPETPAPATSPAVPQASQEELSCLAHDLACIRVARYRQVTLADVREDDVERADVEIAALFKRGDPA